MNNCFENDIVFGKYINYMKKALAHKRIDYLKRKETLLQEKEWIVLSVEDDTMRSFFDFSRKELKDALDLLTEKQKKVLYLNIIKKMTLRKIAEELNVSTKAVEQIKARAISKLKKYLEGLDDVRN